MPVELKGSCHCGAVRFSVQSSTPVPYQVSWSHLMDRALISSSFVCARFAVRLGAWVGPSTLEDTRVHCRFKERKTSGSEHVFFTRELILIQFRTALIKRSSTATRPKNTSKTHVNETFATNARRCCGCTTSNGTQHGSTFLSGRDRFASNRPELVHPFASAIDSPELQSPEELVSVGCMCLNAPRSREYPRCASS